MLNLSKFADWLWVAFQTLIILFHNLMITIVNKMIEAIAAAAEVAIGILPTYTCPTPGQLIESVPFVNVLNWLLPISFFVDVMVMTVFGILTFNAVAPIMRWTKLFR